MGFVCFKNLNATIIKKIANYNLSRVFTKNIQKNYNPLFDANIYKLMFISCLYLLSNDLVIPKLPRAESTAK